MEYNVARAMEICRLDLGQMFQLHEREVVKGRCFLPNEIQTLFNLPGLKVTYEIPEIESSQSAHNQRIRNEFNQHKIYPEFFYLQSLNPQDVHRFDNTVRKLVVDEMKFELRHMGGERRGRLKNVVGEM